MLSRGTHVWVHTGLSPREWWPGGRRGAECPTADLAWPWASLLLSWHQPPYVFNFYFKLCCMRVTSFQISLALAVEGDTGNRQHQLEEEK